MSFKGAWVLCIVCQRAEYEGTCQCFIIHSFLLTRKIRPEGVFYCWLWKTYHIFSHQNTEQTLPNSPSTSKMMLFNIPYQGTKWCPLKEFWVTQCGQLPPKMWWFWVHCSIWYHWCTACLSRNKGSPDKDCSPWGGWCCPRAGGRICWQHGHSHQISCCQVQQQQNEKGTGLLQPAAMHKVTSNTSSTRKPFNQTWAVSCKEETFLNLPLFTSFVYLEAAFQPAFLHFHPSFSYTVTWNSKEHS